jgi:drug/metabolite transporter (DMT)-like permease
VALGAVCFSGKAVVVKLIYRYGADPTTVIALRMALALPFFLLAAAWAGRRASMSSGMHVHLTAADWGRLTLLGVFGYYLASYLDFLGLQYISAGLERLILYLAPTFVLLISAYLLNRPVLRRQKIALGICYAGIAVAFAHDLSAGSANVVHGGALVLASAMSYAIYLVMSGEMVARIGTIRLTATASTIACLLCMAQFALTHDFALLGDLPDGVWSWSIVNATLCTVVPVFATMAGIARVGAPSASLVGMLGPVTTIVFAAILLGEPFTAWQLAGTVLVIAGVMLTTTARAIEKPA